MRTIRISEEVWKAIAERGKFGETEDDVLRRVFGIKPPTVAATVDGRRGRGNTRHATKRMSARVESGQLVVEFSEGPAERWTLPDRTNKDDIIRLRQGAVDFALANGASDPGQKNAVLKALTDAGYYISR